MTPDEINRAGALLPELVAQEERCVFDRFDLDTAWQLGLALVTTARERGLPVAVAITHGRQRVFHAALPGTSADNDGWLDRKRRVVERFGQSSYRVGTGFRATGKTFEADSGLDARGYAAHGGVFPVLVRGVGMVGTVGVSGLPQAEDHALVVEVLEAFLAGRGAS